MISDLLGSSGTITGIDVARHSLTACRTMLQKYELGDRCRLFVVRAYSNSEIFLNGNPDSEQNLDAYKGWTSGRPWKERKGLKRLRKMVSHYQSQRLKIQSLYIMGYILEWLGSIKASYITLQVAVRFTTAITKCQ